MFRFERDKILPQFLCRQITFNQLAKLAGVSFVTAQKAVNGAPITAPVVQKIANALDVIATDFIAQPAQILKG